MKSFFNDPESKKKVFIASISGIIIVSFYIFILHFGAFVAMINNFISIISPFIWGAAMAYLLSFPVKRVSEWLPQKWKAKNRHRFAVVIVMVCFIVAILLFVVMLTPQLISSINSLSKNINNYANSLLDYLRGWITYFGWEQDLYTEFAYYLDTLVEWLISFIQDKLPSLMSTAISGIMSLFNILISFILCLYILLDWHTLIAQIRKLAQALFSQEFYRSSASIVRLSLNKFGSFITGKVYDSLIIGILTYIAMLILKLEYPVLISFIVGITNIIPFFGPFIGAIPGIFILLGVSPIQALIFTILIIAIQQLDGNIIGPLILGDSVGLSSLWIMFAIIVGGSYFGFAGMLLGVPVTAVIYLLIRNYVLNQLEKKGIASDTTQNQ